MTQRQAELLHYIAANSKDGVSPTYREMAHGIGLKSPGRISALLTALKDRGFIDWQPRAKRSVEILRMPEATQ